MDIHYQAQYTYERLITRLQSHFNDYAQSNPDNWNQFIQRLEKNFPNLFEKMLPLYGQVYDAFYYFEELLYGIAESWINRPADLKQLDKQREADPQWFQSEQMIGAVCYVDLFAGSIQGLFKKIPYLLEMGVTYLHLMPLFKVPSGANDGGYAISSYREVNPDLGTMDELVLLAKELRKNGISLVLDFVFNHTAFDHKWALKAQAGDPFYQNFYWMFPDRRMPDAYERHLREIFPDDHSGSFTYFKHIDKWVWTTFQSYQWDLNYQNPAVFVQMVKEMLFLANVGVEILRLDAVAFIWKRLGTSCENLPEAHLLIQAFNDIARIAAPALLFKSEAIVHPNDVIKYISPEECQISYNPLLMALLWESLATREVRLLSHSMHKRLKIPAECAWVNYVRSHDDIGWTFSDEDAGELWINGYDHRQFLNEFYRGRFPGSFARGLPFQENPKTGDCRISGTCASLAGLEKALAVETEAEVELAIKRIVMMYGIILTIGGIPLFYLGDELGTLNDYGYLKDKLKKPDSRWVHRPQFDDNLADQRHNKKTVAGRIYTELLKIIQIRKENIIFRNLNTSILESKNPHVFCFSRKNEADQALVIANFSEMPQKIQLKNILPEKVVSFRDLISGENIKQENFELAPYDFRLMQVL
jgi:glycosidase